MKSALLFALLCVLAGCQNNSEIQRPLTDSTSVYGLTGDAVKLVKTATVNIHVKSVEQTATQVATLAQRLGGRVFHQQLAQVQTKQKELPLSADSLLLITATTPHADITVRVPADSLQLFTQSVTLLGYYTESSTLDIEDKSLEYLQNSLKQEAREEALLQPVTKPSANKIQQAIAVKDEAINQLVSAATTNAAAMYSTVMLSLSQPAVVRKDVIANYALSGYNLPFAARFQQAVATGFHAFINFLLALLHLWLFILAGVAVYLAFKYRQTKKRSVVVA